MYCIKCGHKNIEDAEFCEGCGEKILRRQKVQVRAAIPPSRLNNNINSAVNIIKKFGASPLFLVATILFTVNLSIGLFRLFSGYGIAFILLNSVLPNSQIGYANTYGLFSLFLGLILQLPSILICIGLWITTASSKNKRKKSVKTGGFTSIKVAAAINIVFYSAVILLLLICAIGLIFLSVSMDAVYNSDLYQSAIASGINLIFTFSILQVYAIIFIAILICVALIIYMADIMETINTVNDTVLSGIPQYEIPIFVCIMCFIIACLNIMGAFMNADITGLIAAAAQICFGIVFIQYRNKMQRLCDLYDTVE